MRLCFTFHITKDVELKPGTHARTAARGGYRIRSRSMVIRPHIARSE
jgi:hypothetical protein